MATTDLRATRPIARARLVLTTLAATIATGGALAQTEVGGRIDEDTTWGLAGSPYVVTSTVQVYGDTSPFDGPHDPVTLTIEPGVEVRFTAGTALQIATDFDQGALVAVGTAAQPIVFTGHATFPLRGHWNGIDVRDANLDDVTRIEHAVVEFGGTSTSVAGLRLRSATFPLSNVTVRESAQDCLSVEGGATPDLQSLTLDACSRYGLQINGSSPTVTASVVTATDDSPLRVLGTSSPDISGSSFDGGPFFESASGDAVLSGNTFSALDRLPSRVGADDVGELIAANSLSGASAAATFEVLGEVVDQDDTWPAQPYSYDVLGHVTVAGTASVASTLTIGAGATLRFQVGVGLFVADNTNLGALIAVGTPGSPITFTSLSPTPTAGDWYGLFFDDQVVDATTVVEHAVVEYGGNWNSNNIRVENSSPTLRNLTLREGSVYGVFLNGSDCSPVMENLQIETMASDAVRVQCSGAMALRDSTITAPGGYGVYFTNVTANVEITDNVIDNSIYFEGASGDAVITGNTFSSYDAYPTAIGAQEVDELLNQNTFPDRTAAASLLIYGDVIDADASWPNLGFPYQILGHVTVAKDASNPSTLTLAAGTRLQFNIGVGLFVGDNTNQGALIAVGTPSEPIVFTSNSATPVAGDWYGIWFDDAAVDETSILDHTVIEYGGNWNSNNVRVDNSAPTITNSTIRDSSVYGVFLTGTTAGGTFSGNTFTGNADYDFFSSSSTSHGVTVDGNNFSHGLRLDTASGLSTITDNVFDSYDAFFNRVDADSLGLMTGNVYNGTTADSLIEVLGDVVTEDATWVDPGVRLRFLGNVTVRKDTETAATLTLVPGLELAWNPSTGLFIGDNTNLGALIADGTPAEPILFTSANEVPAPGDWYGIYFDDQSVDATCLIDEAIVEYGGQTYINNIRADNSAPTVTNSIIRHSSFFGIHLTGDSAGLVLTGSSFSDNADYDVLTAFRTTHDVTIDSNTFTNGVRIDDVSGQSTVTDNVFDDYDSFFLRVDADSIDLMSGNVFNGTVAESVIEVLAEDLRADATWANPGLPYDIVNDSVDLRVLGDATTAATLTLEPGVEIRHNFGTRFVIADNTNMGALVAIGTDLEPIVFTSRQPTRARSDWEGILFDDATDDATSVLDRVTIEYAGRSGTACVQIDNSSPTLQRVHCAESGNYGIWLSGEASPQVLDGTIDGITLDGVRVGASTTATPLIQGNVLTNVDSNGFYFEGETLARIVGNTITMPGNYGLWFNGIWAPIDFDLEGNTIDHGLYVANNVGNVRTITGNAFNELAGFDIRVVARDVHQLVNADNTFAGMDADSRIEVWGGQITRPSRWRDVGIPYHVFSGDVSVFSGSAGTPVAMKIDANVRVEFASGSAIRVGDGSNQAGALRAIGTEAEPVVLTSSAETPAAGDWEGIVFESNSLDDVSRLDHVIVEYGGQTNSSNVRLNDASPTIRNSAFNDSSVYGIYGTGTSSPVLQVNTFERNADYDVRFDGATDAEIVGNTFSNGLQLISSVGSPTIENNVFDDYVDNFLRVGAADLANMSGNVFNDVGPDAVIEVVGERISTSAIWTNPGIPYAFVSGDVFVFGTSFVPATLTIEPGTELRFQDNLFQIGGSNGGERGALVAVGTAALPIVFTSNKETPAPGDWRGIYFHRESDNEINTLQFCTVEYGGQTYSANVRFDTSSANVVGSTIRESSVYGIYSTTSEGAPTIQANTFEGNVSYDVYFDGGTPEAQVINNVFNRGLYFATAAGDPLVQSNTFNDYTSNFLRVGASSLDDLRFNIFDTPSADAAIEVIGETLSEDATWVVKAVPYRVVTGDVVVYTPVGEAPATLTLQQGMRLEFASGSGLRINTRWGGEDGELVADGTPAQPITFTATGDTPVAGAWEGIYFEAGGSNEASILDYVIIEYGGQTYSANLRMGASSPTVTNSIFRHSSIYGLYASEAVSSPTVDNCTFEDNLNYDLFISGTSDAVVTNNTFNNGALFDSAGGDAIFQNNVLNNYSANFLRIGVGSLDDFTGNVFNGATADSLMELVPEDVNVDSTIPNLGFPYNVLAGHITVRKDAVESATLTIESGVTMRWTTGYGLFVGDNTSIGSLVAVGTEAEPIVFTSINATPAAGDWYGIYFDDATDDATSVLEHVVVEYGGNWNSNNIRVENSSPTIRNSTIRHSSVYGVFMTGSTAGPTIEGNVFSDNADYDVWVSSSTVHDVTLDGNVLPHGIRFDTGAGKSVVTNNTFDDYSQFFIRIDAESLVLMTGNTFNNVTEDSVIEVHGEAIRESGAWPDLGFPYRMLGHVTVIGDTVTPAVVTIPAGTTMKFDIGFGLFVGDNTNLGSVIAVGTVDEPILFTSSAETPSPGDWYGIYFDGGTDDATALLDHVIVEYGGNWNSNNIRVEDSAPTIRNSTIRHSSVYGIFLTGSTASPSILGNTFSDNADYDVWNSSSTTHGLVADGNTFTHGLRLDTTSGQSQVTNNIFDGYSEFFLRVDLGTLGNLSGNVFNDTTEDSVIEVLAETLAEDATWVDNAGMPFHLLGGFVVRKDTVSAATLTLSAGLTLKFAPASGMFIGDNTNLGALVVQGTPSEPVLLTSAIATPAPGDWQGLYFDGGTDDANTLVEYATIEYGGEFYSNNVRIDGASPTLRNCTFAHSSVYGIFVTESSNGPTIESSTFVGNADYDILYSNSNSSGVSTIDGNTLEHGIWTDHVGADIRVTNNVFQGYNDGFYVKVPLHNADDIAGNVFEDTDATSVVWLEGMTLADDLTIGPIGVPFQVTEFDVVMSRSRIEAATLTVQPGTELRWETGRGLYVGTNTTQGGLVAVGTPAQPIVFTTADTVAPAGGQWEGLYFDDGTSFATVVEEAVVEYGGETTGSNVRFENSGPTFRNVTVRESSGRGFFATNSNGLIEGCTVSGNATQGIYEDGTSDLTIADNTITGNGDYGVYFTTTSDALITDNAIEHGLFFASAAGSPTIAGNTFDDFEGFPIRVGAGTVPAMSGNAYLGVGPASRVEVLGEQIAEDGTWADLGFPYRVVAGWIHPFFSTTFAPTLTLDPGVHVEFMPGTRLQVGSGSSQGALQAIGTELDPIVLTSGQETPAAGDWHGVYFDSATVDADTRMEWVVVEYAGDDLGASIEIQSSNPTLERVSAAFGSGDGLELHFSSAEVSFSSFTDHVGYGVEINSSSAPILRHNDFTGNTAGAVTNTSSPNADARLNWWGAVDGPGGDGGGGGASVTGAVVYEPWLAGDPTLATPGDDHIVDLYATTPTFTPGSYNRYFAEFAESTTWTLEVIDSGGGVVRSYAGSGTLAVQDFDGRDTGGVDLVDGTYDYQLSGAGDVSGTPVVMARGRVTIDGTVPIGEIDNVAHLDVFAVGDQVDVLGSAEMGSFLDYTLQYGTGLFPTGYTNIVDDSSTPVAADVLGTWDTTNLTSGTYALRLVVDNDLGEQTVVALGGIVLSIDNLSADLPAFSPDGNGVKDEVTVSATLSTPSDWTIEVRDGLDATVRTFAGNGSQVAQVWDGTLADGVTIAPEDTYTFVLEATDGGAMVANDTASTRLDLTPPVAEITAPDGIGSLCETIDVVGSADDVGGELQDYVVQFGIGPSPDTMTNIGSVVTTPVVDDVLASWLTNDTEATEPVVNGNYLLQLTANDVAGNSTQTSTLIALDNYVIGNVEVSAASFMPALGEVLDVDFRVNKGSDVTLTIYGEEDGSAGTPIYTAMQTVASAGSYSFVWPGTDDGGIVVADEAYVYVLDGAAPDGCSDRFDPTGGRLTGANSGGIPATYDPYSNQFWEMDLNVSTGGRVRMTVTPTGETGFQEIDRVPFPVGITRIRWDGRRPDGSLVEQASSFFFDPPITLRPHAVVTDGESPDILTILSDPYLMYVSYGGTTDLQYSLATDALVTVKVIPAGFFDPAGPEAILLIDNELQAPGEHTVSWDALDGADPNENLSISELEGAYSFTVEATNPATGRSQLRYGVINVFN